MKIYKKNKRELQRIKRHQRIRVHQSGSPDCPRLIVHRSLKNMHAQVIDDINNRVLFSMSTLDKQLKQKFTYSGNVKAAASFGEEFGKKAKTKGISKVVFDRGGYIYTGRIKVFADGARKGGLVF